MTDDEEIALAKRLPKGSRRALLAMTKAPTYPSRTTFNSNAAHNLSWRARKHGGLAQLVIIDGRGAYYITPLGERIRDRILAQAIEGQRAATAETGAVHESAVGTADAPKE